MKLIQKGLGDSLRIGDEDRHCWRHLLRGLVETGVSGRSSSESSTSTVLFGSGPESKALSGLEIGSFVGCGLSGSNSRFSSS